MERLYLAHFEIYFCLFVLMMFDHANNLARKACLALASAYPVFVSHTISNQIQQANPEQASDWSA